jgi:DNA-binding MarR family transcriptional regulator
MMTKATGPKYSRADIEEALRNLVRKGLVITKEDEDGRTRYFVNPLASVPN